MFRPAVRRSFVSLMAATLSALLGPAARADEGNPRIDYRRFATGVAEVEQLRQSRRISEDEFIALAARPDTVVLDARSREKYDLLHVRGARHLNFSDITAAELAKVIPTKDTRVLIYCNNNFENEEQAFAVKTACARRGCRSRAPRPKAGGESRSDDRPGPPRARGRGRRRHPARRRHGAAVRGLRRARGG